MAYRSSVCTAILVTLISAPTLARGPAWDEPPGDDAGKLPGSAQIVEGRGALQSISGRLEGLATAAGTDDFEDMFLIQIVDPDNFRAQTVMNNGGPAGEATFDTQLWLFDEDGFGLLANDNASLVLLGSAMFPPADDGTDQSIPAPGRYLLAITGFNDDPLSAGGRIFDQATREEISGPDGAGGAQPIIAWASPGATGTYVIGLEGAAFVDDVAVPTVSEWGLIIIAMLVLTGGTIVLQGSKRVPFLQ